VLSVHRTGVGGGDPVVLVHGFTQTGRVWTVIAGALSAHHEVFALDAPGHGGSSQVAAGLPDGADLMVETAARSGASPAAWVGYSMGGRYALHVALGHPGVVDRLVLVSATAGIEDPDERAERRARDDELAARLEREGVEVFVDRWLQLPMFQTLPPDAAERSDRLSNTAAGLAASLRRAGTGTQEPLWDRLASLRMPVLVIAGALDTTYVDHARRLADGIGDNATLMVLEDAGHACHLERPVEFTELLTRFLAGSNH
jgi:2-succinyl-6-hydroxy-2,4-cyclohexadiene-1-carboxylate synthase